MDDKELIYDSIEVKDGIGNIIYEEVIEVVDLYQVEQIPIESDEAFPALGEENKYLNHALMNNKELPDQHPITAVTGLREELDGIHALKTVYSDAKCVAEYFEWEDGNPLNEDRTGLFVSVCHEDIRKIKICDGGEIFGIIVDDAAFVGGQDIIERDYNYGLVAQTGVVHVRRELDVEIGDYVVSDSYGMARKSDSNLGYKVIALHDIGDRKDAAIALNIQVDQLDLFGTTVNNLDERVTNAEANIASTMRVANEAYAKASEARELSEETQKNTSDAIGKIDNMTQDIDDLSEVIASANRVATEARVIADIAVTSAESMRQEALQKANEALTEAEEVREELNNTAFDMSGSLSDMAKDLQRASEDLATNRGAIADVRKIADDNKAELDAVAGYTTGDKTGLAGLVAQVNNDKSEIGVLALYNNSKSGRSGISGLVADVDENTSELELVSEYTGTNENGEIITGLAGLKAQVDTNRSNVTLVSNRVAGKYEVVDYWNQPPASKEGDTWADQTKTDVVYYVRKTKEKDESGQWVDQDYQVYYYYKDSKWMSTDDSYEAGLPASVAGIQVVTDDNSSKIDSLTSWQGTTYETLTSLQQKSDENGSYIQGLVASVDIYSVGEYSQAYRLTREQATEILKEGMVYIPIKHGSSSTHTETYGSTLYEFTYSNYYAWEEINDGTMLWKEYPNKVWFGTTKPSGESYTYWFDGEILYLMQKNNDGVVSWFEVDTLASSMNNRTMSMVRQDVNSVTAEVVNARGDYAGLGARLTNTESVVQSVASWKSGVESDVSKIATIEQKANDATSSISLVVEEKNGSKVINAASIVTSINSQTGTSAINLDADHINFEAGNYTIQAGHINLNGAVTANNYFKINTDGSIVAAKGEIAGWTINSSSLFKEVVGADGVTYGIGFYPGCVGKNKDDGSINAVLRAWYNNENGSYYNFYVDGKGKLYARGADIAGIMTATSGKIGNLHLSNNKLFCTANATNSYVSGLNGGYVYSSGNTIFLWAGARGGDGVTEASTQETFGKSDWTDAKNIIENTATFYVTHSGGLYAKAGKIGNWNIETNCIKSTAGDSTVMLLSYPYYYHSNDASTNRAADVMVVKVGDNYPYSLWKDGTLNCTKANITGTVNITGGSVIINDIPLTEEFIQINSNNINHTKMSSNYIKIMNNGCLTEIGLGGNIRWYDIDGVQKIQVGRGGIVSAIIRDDPPSSSGAALYIDNNGKFYKSASSERYKKDITSNITHFYPENLLKLPLKEYRYKEDHFVPNPEFDDLFCGFIAEDVAKFYPHAVCYDKDGNVEMWDAQRLLPPMLDLIQKLYKRVEALEKGE